jgi:hypothetical protein
MTKRTTRHFLSHQLLHFLLEYSSFASSGPNGRPSAIYHDSDQFKNWQLVVAITGFSFRNLYLAVVGLVWQMFDVNEDRVNLHPYSVWKEISHCYRVFHYTNRSCFIL